MDRDEVIIPLSEHPAPKLLLIEDDLDTAELIQECLEDHFSEQCVTTASRLDDARAMDLSIFELILSDMNLPDGSGLELLEEILSLRPDMPVVFVTGEGILENAIRAIRQGAYDYIVKAGDYLFAIPLVVEKNLTLWRVKRDNERLQAELEEKLEEINDKNRQLEDAVNQLETMAATDPLTGLFNRRAFTTTIHRSFAHAHRHEHDLSCVMVDLDGFKMLNDTMGHPDGDEMLQLAAKVMEANCRQSDSLGRFGGDEFIILMPETSIDTAEAVAQRVLSQFEIDAQRILSGRGFGGQLTMSMGIASLQASRGTTPEQLIAAADHALYAAKAAGKGRIRCHTATMTRPGDMSNHVSI